MRSVPRRIFLKNLGLSGTVVGLGTYSLFRESNQEILKAISNQGCGRATGYAEANKMVTLGEKTHVTWLDSDPEGFWVRIKTFNRKNQSWSPTYTVGKAHDNHGGPALSCDALGYLHIIYYPHHHPMRYRKSLHVNDASLWGPVEEFGEKTTYPTMICGPDNTLYCTFRRQHREKPWEVEMWYRKPKRKWEFLNRILIARYPGYAHFQESLALSRPDQSLHLCCRIHEKSDQEAYGRIQSIAYLRSNDFGKTWRQLDDSPVELPASAGDLNPIATGGFDQGRILRVGGMGLSQQGKPYLIYSIQAEGSGKSYLTFPTKENTWIRKDLTDVLPEKWKDWSMIMPGNLAFNNRNQMWITAQIQQTSPESTWGHPSNEVVLIRSDDLGRSFSINLISKQNPEISNWLPSIERNTGHHAIPGTPGLMFTAGPPGAGNSDLIHNQVFVRLIR